MGFLQALSVASIALASSVQAAVSSTGFTVSLNDVNYFLPGKPTASISGCEELQALFKDGPFVPFTVVKNGSIDAAAYSEDDVWQPAFLEGMLRPLQRSSDDSILTRTSYLHSRKCTNQLFVHHTKWCCIQHASSMTLLYQCCW